MKLEELKIYFSISITLALRDYKKIAKSRWYFNENWKTLSYGFTLAEVLVTLSIIGILAAMTTPGLIADSRVQQAKVAWKKTFSELQQAIYQLRHEGVALNAYKEARTFKPAIIKYFQVKKDCGYAWQCSMSSSYTQYTDSDGTVIPHQVLDDGAFITLDGKDFYFENPGAQTLVFVDVNGRKKKPNKLGVDFFGAKIVGDQLLPLGAKGTGTSLESSCDSNLNHVCSVAMGQFDPPCDGACNSYKYLMDME